MYVYFTGDVAHRLRSFEASADPVTRGAQVALAAVFLRTAADWDTQKQYWTMFVGVLGWVDTPLGSADYLVFGILLLGLAAISIQIRKSAFLGQDVLALVAGSVASLFLIFFIQLVSWTPHPAQVIVGVQGRYFYPVLILLGFSLFGRHLPRRQLRIA